MEALEGNIFSILDGKKQFIIPVYQRYYSWDLTQCKRLWNDIVSMQKEEKQGHFIGSIVNIAEQTMPTGVQTFMIIDGQQRVTTLTLLLIALRNYAKNHPEDESVNADEINNTLLKNPYQKGEKSYKLLLTETDKKILMELIEDRPISSSVNSRLIQNLEYFNSQILKRDISPFEIYESIGKLQIVNITLKRDIDDAQAIFESLNSTGKELSEADLIRNHILMGISSEKQTYIYEHYWRPMEILFEYEHAYMMDRFFRDYLTMKLARIPKISDVYEEFKKYHKSIKFSSLEQICEELYTYSKYYTNMMFSRSDNAILKQLYSDIISLRMEVAYPFLMKIHKDYDENQISVDELIEIIKICISYVIRRSVCDIPTNSLNKTFATLKNEIHENDYVNSIKAFFLLRDDYKVFPDDVKFTEALKSKELYKMRNRNFILSHLENYKNKSPIIIENYTIEHIMPQNPNLSETWKNELGENWKEIQKKYLHTIGNLTLTAYNSEMSDRSFTEKMNMTGGFKESALRLNKYIVVQTTWNEDTIIARAGQLAEKAVEIWQYPHMTDEELKPYKKESTTLSNYNLEIYKISDDARILFDVLDKRICNLSSDVKREFKKLYIAYKLENNFADIVVQKERLKIFLNIDFSDILDPYKICKDVTDIGKWGNGNVEIHFEDISDINKIMYLIKQSFDKQIDN